MAKMIFVNLPVTDLPRAVAFYAKLGFEQNAAFSNAQAAMMAWSDTISVMLLTRDFFASMTDRTVGDPRQTYTALLCLSRDSRADVDAIAAAATAAGGTSGDAQDHGFMYARDVYDPDGNGFQMMWMDVAAATAQPAEAVA